MTGDDPLLASQLVVRVCLFLVAAIAMFGGTLQMVLGQPDTAPRLDNVHRFMAGVYLATGIISLWAAVTIRQQGTLVYLLALGVLLAGVGRLIAWKVSRHSEGRTTRTRTRAPMLDPDLVMSLGRGWAVVLVLGDGASARVAHMFSPARGR